MYESLIPWCVFPVNVHHLERRTASGDKVYQGPVEVFGYRVDDMKVITDRFGQLYTSYSRVYFKPEENLKMDDCLSFPEDPALREIRRLSSYFDGNTGERSIWIAYL